MLWKGIVSPVDIVAFVQHTSAVKVLFLNQRQHIFIHCEHILVYGDGFSKIYRSNFLQPQAQNLIKSQLDLL
jgi:hypothetical protein